MNPTVLADGARALRALPPLSLDVTQIPALGCAAPPTIAIAMPDGSTLELPGSAWPQPDVWASTERRVALGERPPVEIRRLTRKEANVLCSQWHPLGAETRPFGYHAFALFVRAEPVALATAGNTHSAVVDSDHGLDRRNVIELTRLCRSPQPIAAGSARVILRAWRDFLAVPYWPYFPSVEKVALVSYSLPGKAGHLYRHDGWERLRGCHGSGGGGTWSGPSRAGRPPEALWVYWLAGPRAASEATAYHAPPPAVSAQLRRAA